MAEDMSKEIIDRMPEWFRILMNAMMEYENQTGGVKDGECEGETDDNRVEHV
jgi:hypothetical protein